MSADLLQSRGGAGREVSRNWKSCQVKVVPEKVVTKKWCRKKVESAVKETD